MKANTNLGQKNPHLNLSFSSGSFLIELTIDLSNAKIKKPQTREKNSIPITLPFMKVLPAAKEVITAKKDVIITKF